MLKRMRDDIRAVFEQDPAMRSVLEIITTYTGLHAAWNHLIAHKLYKGRRYVTARMISQLSRFFTGIEIHPGAKIGERLFIDHDMGIVIGEACTIGDNVTIYQGITLGGTGREKGKRHPDISDNVLTAAGSKILGNTKIESSVNTGANSVVLQSVPSYTTAVDVPGHIVKQEDRRVSKTFDHRSLPSPLCEQIKHLERQFERAKNGKIQDDYII